ncbi:hypothetical protein KPL74_04870 [Bacillus sp. NP157]|nr:hypothetical protein KPL74_04870 [Bacillus sp. NP157]
MLEHMYRLFSMFPSGAPGLGLLSLRCGVALSLWPLPVAIVGHAGEAVAFWCAGGLCMFMLLGLFTPVMAVACMVVLGIHGFAVTDAGQLARAFALQALPVAMLLLGPGAYSIDSAIYGHRAMPMRRDPPR